MYIPAYGGEDILFDHVYHCERFNIQYLAVILEDDLIAAHEFNFTVDMMVSK